MTFDILDRITGSSWSLLDEKWAKNSIAIIVKTPAAWLVVSLLMWVAFMYILNNSIASGQVGWSFVVDPYLLTYLLRYLMCASVYLINWFLR